MNAYRDFKDWRISRKAGEGLALTGVVALATALRFANLAALGEANHYYAAAVQAMIESWHNFFFVAAEPGASVSVDKPPVGLWIQAISARILGVNTLGLLLPEILAGIASAILVYYLVRRSFGAAAGLVAGLALAITPVVVATDRNNTIDSTLILALLFAAWAFVKATETGKLRFLLPGAVLVGLGFNIKMLQAYLPLPAFLALYLLGSRERWWAKLGKLSLALVVLLVVSLSWATIVDLTPADQRPYVGSSSNNTELDLIAGYNGMQRLLGMGGRSFSLAGLFGQSQVGGQSNGPSGQPFGAPTGGFQPGQGAPGGVGLQPQASAGGQGGPGGGGGPGIGGLGGGPGGEGFMGTGNPGVLRLFTTPLSKEASWLLPFGLFSLALLLLRARPHWPLASNHQAAVLWGGWLLTTVVFFSIAGFFHQYYLSMIAPALAALVGIGIGELLKLSVRHAWVALVLLVLASSATLWLQYVTAAAYVRYVWWLPLTVALAVVGGVLGIPWMARLSRRAPVIGFACILFALLITPGIWSALTTLDSSSNQSLPAAYDGQSSGPANGGRSQTDQTLLEFLEANTQGIKYLLAVPSSMQGADYVLSTGRPVLYLGGFNGQDRVISSTGLAKLVADGELRYIYWDGRGSGFGGPGGVQSDISTWVSQTCKAVDGYDAQTQNQGAPDGTAGQSRQNTFGGSMRVSLYDCKS